MSVYLHLFLPVKLTLYQKWKISVNLRNSGKDLKTERLKKKKTKLSEIEVDLNNCRNVPFSCVRGLNSVKAAILSKLVYRFNEISGKNPKSLLVDIDKL